METKLKKRKNYLVQLYYENAFLTFLNDHLKNNVK